MSFIKDFEHDIKFSEKIYGFSARCKGIATESRKNIFTENGVMLQEDCDQVSYACEGSCTRDISSGSMLITNTCAVPLTITGLVLDNPEEFSLFESSYSAFRVYEERFNDHMPIVVQPGESYKLPTFFTPGVARLEKEERKTLNDDDRVGTSCRVDVYPGFPIFKEGAEDMSCNTHFVLTGEFMCPVFEETDLEWMYNKSNYVSPEEHELKRVKVNKVQNKFYLKRTPIVTRFFKEKIDEDNWNKGYGILKKGIEAFAEEINERNWFQSLSANWAITGSMDLVHKLLSQRINDGKDIYSEDYTSDFNVTAVDKISTSFFDHSISHPKIEYQGNSYIGFNINTEPRDLPIGFIRDQTLFMSLKNKSTSLNNASKPSNSKRSIQDLLKGSKTMDLEFNMFLMDSGEIEDGFKNITMLKYRS